MIWKLKWQSGLNFFFSFLPIGTGLSQVYTSNCMLIQSSYRWRHYSICSQIPCRYENRGYLLFLEPSFASTMWCSLAPVISRAVLSLGETVWHLMRLLQGSKSQLELFSGCFHSRNHYRGHSDPWRSHRKWHVVLVRSGRSARVEDLQWGKSKDKEAPPVFIIDKCLFNNFLWYRTKEEDVKTEMNKEGAQKGYGRKL